MITASLTVLDVGNSGLMNYGRVNQNEQPTIHESRW